MAWKPMIDIKWLSGKIVDCQSEIMQLKSLYNDRESVTNEGIREVLGKQIEDLKKKQDEYENLFFKATGHYYDDIPF